MNPNTTARRLLLLATTIHVAIATVSSSSSQMTEGRTFLRSGRKESLVGSSTTNTKSDTIRRLFFQEKDNLFDATESQNDFSEDGIGETGIAEPSDNTNMDEPIETAAAAAVPEQSESVLDEIDFEDTADSSETKVQTEVEVEGQIDTETNSTEPVTPANTTDASDAQDPTLEETTAEEKTRKLMNEYVFGTVVAVLVLLYLLYWRDNVVHQKLEFLQKQQEQRDRLKNLQLRASLETEAISLDGSFTNAGMILAEEIRFSPQHSDEIPKNIMTADRAIDAIRTIGRGGKKTQKTTKDRDTSHTEKTALSEIFDMHDDDNDDEYELSSSRRPKSARRTLASEEHWFKYSSSLRSNKGEAFEAKSDSS